VGREDKSKRSRLNKERSRPIKELKLGLGGDKIRVECAMRTGKQKISNLKRKASFIYAQRTGCKGN